MILCFMSESIGSFNLFYFLLLFSLSVGLVKFRLLLSLCHCLHAANELELEYMRQKIIKIDPSRKIIRYIIIPE